MTRVALITGGTRGIGAAIATALTRNGYRVAATYAADDQNAAAFQADTGIKTYRWNISDYDACQEGVSAVEADLGPVEILVNNAGITRDSVFHKMSRSDWHEVLNTNLNGLFNMTHQVWPGMRARKFGRIVNISSINGQRGQFGQVNYSASKAGELGFSRSLAQEGAAFGITVNAVCPGYIGTEMTLALPEKLLAERIVPSIPAGRLGRPEEIARCVVFLAADESSFINGATLSANGAQLTI